MVKPIYLLDTNTWIYALKGSSVELIARLGSTNPESISFCSIVKAELLHGALRYGNPQRRQKTLNTLFEQHTSFSFDDHAARIYAGVRFTLEKDGQVIGPMDLLIASIALANELIVVTHNTSEFSRIVDLKVEDWTKAP